MVKFKCLMQKTIIILCLCFICTFSTASTPNPYGQSVNNTINHLMQQYQIPGAAVAIVDHNHSYAYVFGVANKNNNIPVTKKTIFEIGSLTKIFTALAFAVTSNSRSNLSTPITNYSMFSYYWLMDANPLLRQMSIENLLTYTSGLPFKLPEDITTIEQLRYYLAKWRPSNQIGMEWGYSSNRVRLVWLTLKNMVLKYLADWQPLNQASVSSITLKLGDGIFARLLYDVTAIVRWQPWNQIGMEWQYSNVSIGLVGIALANMKGIDINQLYKKYIFTPLGMSHTSFVIPKQSQTYFAQGYDEQGKEAKPLQPGLFPAAGDLKSNIEDMSIFLALAAGTLHAFPNLTIAMQETQTPKLEVDNALQGLVWQIHSLHGQSFLHEPENMNLGPIPVKWLSKGKQVFDANKLIDKTGATAGFRAYIAVIPEKQAGIVILLNKYISNGAIVNAGRKILLGTNHADVK